MMRAFAFVFLAAVAVNAEAEADSEAYTIGQVSHGFTNGGVITGVDYGHGAVSGFGAIGNRHAVPVVSRAYSGYSGIIPGNHYTGNYYGNYYGNYGKREAEAEPEAEAEADPFFYNGIYGASVYGHSVVPAVRTVHSVVPAVNTVHSVVPTVNTVAAVPAVHSVAAAVPAVHSGVVSTYGHSVVPTVNTVAAVPAVHSVAAAVPAVRTTLGRYTVGVPSIYNTYGKREAEAEPEAEAEAEADPLLYNGIYGTGVVSTYGHSVVPAVNTVHSVAAVPRVHSVVPAVNTVHSVAAAVPAVHSGVISTYGHSVVPAVHSVAAAVPAVHSGVVSTYGHSVVPAVHSAIPAVHTTVAGHTAVSTPYSRYGYTHFGKREAEPYTVSQVAHGLPFANAYATGHPYNVGYTRYISSSPYTRGFFGHRGYYQG